MFLVFNVSIDREDQFHCMRMSLKVSLSQISDSFIINQGLLKENTNLIYMKTFHDTHRIQAYSMYHSFYVLYMTFIVDDSFGVV